MQQKCVIRIKLKAMHKSLMKNRMILAERNQRKPK